MNQNFFKKAGVRAIALLLTFIMLFSILPLTTFAATVNEKTNRGGDFNPATTVAKHFTDQIYSCCYYAVGLMLTGIADSTEDEAFKELASIINVWVLGNDNTAALLADLQNTCNKILDEVQNISTKLDVYAANIESHLSRQDVRNYQDKIDTIWSNEIEVLNDYKLYNAFDNYYKIDLLNGNAKAANSSNSTDYDYYKFSKTDGKNGLGYLPAALSVKTNSSVCGNTYSMSDLETFRENLHNDFKKIYLDNSTLTDINSITDEKLYTDNFVDQKFQLAINKLIKMIGDSQNINKSDYEYTSALLAYSLYPNMCDQYEFLHNQIDKQIMLVTVLEMLYQEFLSMRGEYLEKNYPTHDGKIWTDYNSCVKNNGNGLNGIIGLNVLNDNFMDAISKACLDRAFDIDGGCRLKLNQYPQAEDSIGAVLHTDEYCESKSYKDYTHLYYDHDLRPSSMGRFTTEASITSPYMSFKKMFTCTTAGLQEFYMLKGDEDKLSINNLILKNGSAYFPSCDFFNLTQCKYSDGIANYVCPSSVASDSYIYNSNSYALYGSQAYTYLNLETMYPKGNVYQIFNNGFTLHMNVKDTELDMLNTKTRLSDLSVSNSSLDTLRMKDLYNNNKDNANKSDYFTLLLLNEDVINNGKTELKNTLSVGSNDSNTKITVTDSAGKAININDPIPCGKELTFTVEYPADRNPVSVELYRYNDVKSPNTPTSETTILTSDEIYSFDAVYNAKTNTNTYTFYFTMPYSNCKFVFDDSPLQHDSAGNFIIRTYDDLLTMASCVNSGVGEGEHYILADNIDCSGKTWSTPIGTGGNRFKGTFDGQGYTISNFSMNGFDKEYSASLFGCTEGATIKNLNITGKFNLKYVEDITNPSPVFLTVGGICSDSEATTIKNCMCNIDINGDGDIIGGICGLASIDSLIENCAYLGTINCNCESDYVSGIANICLQSSIKNCYSLCDNSSIAPIYNYWSVFAEPDLNDYVKNCYYLNGKEDKYSSQKSKEQFKYGEVAYLLNNGVTDGTQAWYQNLNNGLTPDNYPVLVNNEQNTVYKVDNEYSNYPTSEYNIVIKTYEDLVNMASRVNSGFGANKHYILANDIDCADEDWPVWYTPIGTKANPFKGVFDGQGHTISNLVIGNEDHESVIALFGVIDNGTIENLNISDASTYAVYSGEAQDRAAVLCSSIKDGTITNCSVDGRIILNSNIYTIAGGICGEAENTTIELSMCSVKIVLDSIKNSIKFPKLTGYLGGICGKSTGCKIENCGFVSTVSVPDKYKEYICTSGITNSDNTEIDSCYSACPDALDYAISQSENVDNSYYLTKGTNASKGESMSEAQFESGEVAYLLNNGTTDGTQAWYQNLDNGLTPDSYPVLVNNDQNTVYKVDCSDKEYSNYPTGSDPATEPTEQPTTQPTTAPATEPTEQPATQPTTAPATEPTEQPTTKPSTTPTNAPTDGYYIYGSNICLKLTSNGGDNVCGTIVLAKGAYTFKVDDNGTLLGYGKIVKDFTTGGLTFKSNYISSCTLNATGGVYTFQFNTKTKTLVIKQDSDLSPSTYLIGDINAVLTSVKGQSYAVGTIYLEAGEYNFNLVHDDVTYGCKETVNDSTDEKIVDNGKKDLNSSYKSNVTLIASGGAYTFEFNKTTGELVITKV